MNLFTSIFYFTCLSLSYCLADSNSLYCTDLRPQNNVDINELQGMWYGSEILMHHPVKSKGNYGTSEIPMNTCVIIHINDITHEMPTLPSQGTGGLADYQTSDLKYYGSDNSRLGHPQYYHYLKLLWIEEKANLEYTLRFNTTMRGFWVSMGPQKGTMTSLNYNQFSGTIQVMKAVADHLVLTFCQKTEGNELFSIVLSRRPNSLSQDDINSVRRTLHNRGLGIAQIRRVCTGSASKSTMSIVALISAALCICLFEKRH